MKKFALFCLLLASAAVAQARSASARLDFAHTHACPSTHRLALPCPGYVIDHVVPLDCGGADAPRNMQWQTTAASRAKDKWERNGKNCKHRTKGARLL